MQKKEEKEREVWLSSIHLHSFNIFVKLNVLRSLYECKF